MHFKIHICENGREIKFSFPYTCKVSWELTNEANKLRYVLDKCTHLKPYIKWITHFPLYRRASKFQVPFQTEITRGRWRNNIYGKWKWKQKERIVAFNPTASYSFDRNFLLSVSFVGIQSILCFDVRFAIINLSAIVTEGHAIRSFVVQMKTKLYKNTSTF